MMDTGAVSRQIESLSIAFREHVKDDVKRFDDLSTSMSELNKNVSEILEIIRAFKLGKGFLVGLSISIGSLIAIIMGLRQILSWLR